MKSKTETKLKRALRAKKFDARLRQEAVEFSRQAGSTVTDAALRLGMKPNTLHRWHQRAGKAEAPAINFVEVEGAPSVEGLEVVWPTGHLIRMGTGDLKSVFAVLEATCCSRG